MYFLNILLWNSYHGFFLKEIFYIVASGLLITTSLQAAEVIQCTTVGWEGFMLPSNHSWFVDCKKSSDKGCGKLLEVDSLQCSVSATEIVCKLRTEDEKGFDKSDTLTINRKTGDAVEAKRATQGDYVRSITVKHSDCKKVESANKL